MTELNNAFKECRFALSSIRSRRVSGTLLSASGLTADVGGLGRFASVGERCSFMIPDGRRVSGEVIAFKGDRVTAMLYGPPDGLSPGTPVELLQETTIRPSGGWVGRVVDAFGRPVDGLGLLDEGDIARSVRGSPPSAYERKAMGERIETGLRSFDTFIPLCRGQRLGIFSGSGVGKSTLMGMLARGVEADVVVLGLVGERGREVRDFLDHVLGPEGLARSVVVVATSDQPPPIRRRAAWTAMTIAEHFRDAGKHVLCLIDSVTRFAMAQREIGLAAGEPPTSKAFPPSAFSEMASLLERAGPGPEGAGDITGIFTVLVEGGDHDEPVSDTVRGILDGHVVLERRIAENGRFPAIDILKSVSRALPKCHTAEENAILMSARKLASTYENMEELIRLGAYRRGSDPDVDAAIAVHGRLDTFLAQQPDERTPSPESFGRLNAIISQTQTRR
jgi:flagellum-specific ATP synthase